MDYLRELVRSGLNGFPEGEGEKPPEAQAENVEAIQEQPSPRKRGRVARAKLAEAIEEQVETEAPAEQSFVDEQERPQKRRGRKPKAVAVLPIEGEAVEGGDAAIEPVEQTADMFVEEEPKPKKKRGPKPKIRERVADVETADPDATATASEPQELDEEGLPKVHRKRAPKQPKDYSEITGDFPIKKRGRPKKQRKLEGTEGATEMGEAAQAEADVEEGADGVVAVDGAGSGKKKRGRKSKEEGGGLPRKPRASRYLAPPSLSEAASGFADMPEFAPGALARLAADMGSKLTYAEVTNMMTAVAQFFYQPRAGVSLAQYVTEVAPPVVFKRPEEVQQLLAAIAFVQDSTAVSDGVFQQWVQLDLNLETIIRKFTEPEWWTAHNTDVMNNLKLMYFLAEVTRAGGVVNQETDLQTLEGKWRTMPLAVKQAFEQSVRAGVPFQSLPGDMFTS
jgi:hypothetical protein